VAADEEYRSPKEPTLKTDAADSGITIRYNDTSLTSAQRLSIAGALCTFAREQEESAEKLGFIFTDNTSTTFYRNLPHGQSVKLRPKGLFIIPEVSADPGKQSPFSRLEEKADASSPQKSTSMLMTQNHITGRNWEDIVSGLNTRFEELGSQAHIPEKLFLRGQINTLSDRAL
jgi:hypothetical protein